MYIEVSSFHKTGIIYYNLFVYLTMKTKRNLRLFLKLNTHLWYFAFCILLPYFLTQRVSTCIRKMKHHRMYKIRSVVDNQNIMKVIPFLKHEFSKYLCCKCDTVSVRLRAPKRKERELVFKQINSSKSF